MDHAAFVTQWVLDTVKREYSQDIALVIAHGTLRLDGQPRMSYFVPITDKGRRFAQTFILGGQGFDVWGIEWERLERFAALEDYNLTCLADAEVLYARTPEDLARFEALREQQRNNLADPRQRRARALASLAEAKQLYLRLMFSQGSDAAMYAGHVMDQLARALCFAGGGYFRHAQTDQLAELRAMGEPPDGFCALYEKLLLAADDGDRKTLCRDLITIVETFLRPEGPAEPREHNFQDLADWYAELSYTWLRIRRLAGQGDVTRVYMWGCMLQTELNQVCEDFGLEKMELMSAFDANDLPRFAAHADALEAEMRRRIAAGGGVIREYPDQESFIKDTAHEV